MRRAGAWVLALVCLSLGGCLTGGEPGRPSTWLDRLRAPRSSLGPDAVVLDLIVIEQPLGDAFLNRELWQSTDYLAGGIDRKRLLDDNGLRIGTIVGMNPERLQGLLGMDRYCVTRRRQVLGTGGNTTVTLGATQPDCRFRLRTDAGVCDVILDQGQCQFVIEPVPASEGRTRLKFTPKVLYGSGPVPEYQADKAGWSIQYKRPSQSYPEAAFDVTLASNQVLVIGTPFDEDADDTAPRTLGSQCFLQENGHGYMQRLLVVRVTRGSDETSSWTPEPSAAGGKSVAPAAYCWQP
jgi:hypothetical protein